MIELLLAFSFWPWALCIAFVFLCCLGAYSEITIIAAAAFFLFSIVSWLVYDGGAFVWIASNPLQALALSAVYIIIGAIWSLFKWRNWMASKSVQKKLKTARENFNQNDDKKSFRESSDFPYEVTPSYNKNRIINWISLWPFSVFLYIFYDLLRNLFSHIYNMFSGIYEKITDKYIP